MGGGRDGEGEGRTLAGPGLDADLSAPAFDQSLGRRQAQPQAADVAGEPFLDLQEIAEDVRLVLGLDARPEVADGDLDHVAGHFLGHDFDAGPLAGGELHGVVHQVVQHQGKLLDVDVHLRQLVGQLDLELDLLVAVARLDARRAPLDHLGQGHQDRVVPQFIGRQSGVLQELLDQHLQVLHARLDQVERLAELLVHRPVLSGGNQAQVSADDGQRGLEFVADQGEEIALQFFLSLFAGHVAEDEGQVGQVAGRAGDSGPAARQVDARADVFLLQVDGDGPLVGRPQGLGVGAEGEALEEREDHLADTVDVGLAQEELGLAADQRGHVVAVGDDDAVAEVLDDGVELLPLGDH